MDRLRSIELFLAVAEAGSLVGGARALGLSAPSATRGIDALEARLGARLLTRTTRAVRLTEAGQAYRAACRQILAELHAAEEAAGGAHAVPRGRLAITAPVLFGEIHVMPVVAAFLEAYPAVEVEALLVDRGVDLVDEGIDVAVRIGALADSGLKAVRVGAVRRVVCASPAYLAAHGRPQAPRDLRAHRLIVVRPLAPTPEWRFGDGAVRVAPRLRVSTAGAALAAARAGFGLTQVLSYQAASDLAAGRLERVLGSHEPAPSPIHLVHVEGRSAAAKVRAFVDLATERLRAAGLD
ncbi:MAG: LysR family transcriptional regulator [Paracoccaceae bacterium]